MPVRAVPALAVHAGRKAAAVHSIGLGSPVLGSVPQVLPAAGVLLPCRAVGLRPRRGRWVISAEVAVPRNVGASKPISRIRLSDKTSRLHPRHVVPKPA